MAEFVALELEQRGIFDIRKYTIEEIAERFNIGFSYSVFESKAIILPEGSFIFINNDLQNYEKREDFFHELSHILLGHSNSKLTTAFHLHCEGKADYLMHLLAIPTSELSEYDLHDDNSIFQISEDFKVSLEFVYRRIRLFASNNEFLSHNEREWVRFMLKKNNTTLSYN